MMRVLIYSSPAYIISISDNFLSGYPQKSNARYTNCHIHTFSFLTSLFNLSSSSLATRTISFPPTSKTLLRAPPTSTSLALTGSSSLSFSLSPSLPPLAFLFLPLEPHLPKFKIPQIPPPRLIQHPLLILRNPFPCLLPLFLQPLNLLPLREEVVYCALAAEQVAVRGTGDDGRARGLQAEAAGGEREEGVAAD